MDENLFLKNVDCPMCGKPFKTTKVRDSKIRLIKRDTDLFRQYEGPNPYLYEINVCPECGFSYYDTFKQTLGDNQIERFIQTISQQWTKKDFCGERTAEQAIETYKLALLSSRIIGLKDSVLAGICLRICWLNRMIGNNDEEKKFMKGAVEFFEKAYDKEDLNASEGLGPEMVVYLLGELNYRLGSNPDAVRWFNIALSKYNNDPAVKKHTIDMIRDRWIEIKPQVV